MCPEIQPELGIHFITHAPCSLPICFHVKELATGAVETDLGLTASSSSLDLSSHHDPDVGVFRGTSFTVFVLGDSICLAEPSQLAKCFPFHPQILPLLFHLVVT